VLIGLIKC